MLSVLNYNKAMDTILKYDVLLFRAINDAASPALDFTALAISLPGEYGAFWIGMALLVLVFFKGEARVYGLLALLAMFVSDLVIGHFLRVIYFRPRPYVALHDVHQLGPAWWGSSFPSAHADSSFAGAFVLGKRFTRAKPYLYLFATLSCISRVYLGMHYPMDVLIGALIGLATGFLIMRLYGYYKPHRALKSLLLILLISSALMIGVTPAVAQPSQDGTQRMRDIVDDIYKSIRNGESTEPVFGINVPPAGEEDERTFIYRWYWILPGKTETVKFALKAGELRTLEQMDFRLNFIDEDLSDKPTSDYIDVFTVDPSGNKEKLDYRPDRRYAGRLIPEEELQTGVWELMLVPRSNIKKAVRINLEVDREFKSPEIKLVDFKDRRIRFGIVKVEAIINSCVPIEEISIGGFFNPGQTLHLDRENRVKYFINTFALSQGFHRYIVFVKSKDPYAVWGEEWAEFYVGNNLLLLPLFTAVLFWFAWKKKSLRFGWHRITVLSLVTFLLAYLITLLPPEGDYIELFIFIVFMLIVTLIFTPIGRFYLKLGWLRSFLWLPVCAVFAMVNFYIGALIMAAMTLLVLSKWPYSERKGAIP